MKKYKVDWLAFSVAMSEKVVDFEMLEKLGYPVEDFEEVAGKYFYNSGATVGNYVNAYWNDPERPTHKNSSRTMTVVFTGQGATDLAEKHDSDWQKILLFLESYGANFTRIDLALDDYDETVKFKDIVRKLDKGHYRSSKRSYNVVKSSNPKGEILGETIYLGKARANTGSQGNTFLRMYDKRAQYVAKNEQFPSEVLKHWEEIGKESWQRYELSYSKKYAKDMVRLLVSGEHIDRIFKTSLRAHLELLTPQKGDTNKSRWGLTSWWERFLEFDERLVFESAERDVMLGDVLEWLRVAVAPTLGILEEVGEEKGFDIYDLLKQVPKPKSEERSKKQVRLLNSSLDLPDEILQKYLEKFFEKK